MASDIPDTCLELRTEVTSAGKLELSLVEIPVPRPGPDQVLVRVEATPINPSDLGLLVGPADLDTATASGTAERPAVSADVPAAGMRAVAARVGKSLVAGNEGAGVVVATGDSEAARALMGKTVAMLGGDMYTQYRCLHAAQCMALPAGVTPREGASCFVNPLTALGMTETMRAEGHTALVHTAAASNLGQMLNRICLADDIPLVNIVRKPEQAALLREIGARHVVDSAAPSFMQDLIDALAETGATIAFDAVGGGPLAGQILVAMESAASRKQASYSRYGSATPKQVYIYGRLDLAPTTIPPSVGMAWGASGWLLTYFLQKAGGEVGERLRKRVLDELKTTFASHYTQEISLAQALDLSTLRAYQRKATGEKYLINPSL